MEVCHHTFHSVCLQKHFEEAIATGKPATCPDCTGPANRPNKKATPDYDDEPFERPPGRDTCEREPVIWDRVHYTLHHCRLNEALALVSRSVERQVAPDITRKELYAIAPQTNYFEMVNACWICGNLIGNEFWITTPCKHVFHTYCFVDQRHAAMTGPAQKQSQWSGATWPQTFVCPMCEREHPVPSLETIVPTDTVLTAKCSQHLREMRLEAAWFCLRARYEKSLSPTKRAEDPRPDKRQRRH